jgi:hypothetical protein
MHETIAHRAFESSRAERTFRDTLRRSAARQSRTGSSCKPVSSLKKAMRTRREEFIAEMRAQWSVGQKAAERRRHSGGR